MRLFVTTHSSRNLYLEEDVHLVFSVVFSDLLHLTFCNIPIKLARLTFCGIVIKSLRFLFVLLHIKYLNVMFNNYYKFAVQWLIFPLIVTPVLK